jgi:hypothetical protein
MVTEALIGSNAASSTPTCPVTITADCAGTTISNLSAYFPTSGPTTLTFLVKDSAGRAMYGVPVTYSHSNTSLGSLSVTENKTDVNGRAMVDFTPNTTIGNDVVTATASCANSSAQIQTYSTTLTVKVSRVNVTLGYDCLSTALSGIPRTTTWAVSVQDGSGTVTNVPIRLDVELDPTSLPDPPNFSDYEAELFVGTDSHGTTDSAGDFVPVEESTGGSGTLTGSLRLNRDNPGAGLRVLFNVSPIGTSCAAAGSPVSKAVSFYSFELDSYTPGTGCNEISPCTIPAGTAAPTVKARLTLNEQPLVGATVTFSKTDLHLANPSGTSILSPASTTTDANGEAKTTVGNDATSTITPANPLQTTIDASSTGGASCASGDLQYDGIRPQFRMEGYTGECAIDMQQAWLVKNGGADKLRTEIKNTNSSGGCPVKPVGISVTVYKTDGVTPDPNYKLDKIQGGGICATPGCSSSTALKLFDKACNANTSLPNGLRWDFKTVGTTCVPPPTYPDPGQSFVILLMDFTANLVGTGRKVDITIHYQCTGVCPGVSFSRTFRLTSPAS